MNDRAYNSYLRGFLSSHITLTVNAGKSYHQNRNRWEFRLELVELESYLGKKL